jgi:nucleotide-binding universal stress UspA family protein
MTTKPIVAGTDGSPESIRAVEWAAKEAHLRGTSLRIVSAVEVLPRMTPQLKTVDIETVADALRRHHDWALTAAAKAAAEIAPDVPTETAALDGAAAVAVTGAGLDALLLAVGSRGGGAFAAMTLGSVGRYAAAHAHCPVVVVREETMAAHRQVVVGIRDPHDCDDALGFAFEEAALRNASLTVVHAWHVPRIGDPPVPGYVPESALPQPPSAAVIHEYVARQLEQPLAAWRGKFPGVTDSLDVVDGHPGRILGGLSARADLVVIGRHHTGRVMHALLAHAHGPVAVVPSM